ncbi:MAG TPA: hypothetical protein VF344_02090, partial [Candidatus Limnocylindrales bacterium]
ELVDAVALEREYPPGSTRRVTLGGMTLAVPGATGFVAPAQRAVIGIVSESRQTKPCDARPTALTTLGQM